MKKARPLKLEDYETIGEYIRSHRIHLGKTQEELASSAEVTENTISLIESDHVKPSSPVLVRILRILRTWGAPDLNIHRIK